MAEIKIIRGSRVSPKQIMPAQTEVAAPGALGRTLLAGLGRTEQASPLAGMGRGFSQEQLQQMGGLGALFGLGQAQMSPSSLTEVIKKQFYPEATSEQFEPQSGLESFAHRVAGLAPVTGALGGLPAAARTAIGAIPAAGLQQLGAPESIQDIAQLGTELGLGFLPKSIVQKIPEQIRPVFGQLPTIGKAQKVAQEVLEKTPASPHVAEPIISKMSEIGKQLETERDFVRDKVNEAFRILGDNITRHEIKPHAAVKIRRSLDSIARDLPEDKAAEFIQPLRDSIQDFFSSYSAENPSFYNALKARDKITQLKHMRTFVDKFADLFKFPVAPELGKAVQFGIKSVLGTTAGEAERFIRGIAGNSEARKHYFNLVSAAVQQDPAIFLKNVENLQQIMMPQTPEKLSEGRGQPQATTFKVIRGSRLTQ